MKQRIRIATIPLGLTLAVAGLADLPPAAQAAPTPCVIKGFTPTSVVVGDAAATVTVKPLLDKCTPLNWSVSTASFSATKNKPTVTIDPQYLTTKREDVVVQATYNQDGGTVEKVYLKGLRLKAATEFATKTNASPEPVKKGKKLTVSGRLTVVNWTTLDYQGYRHQSVQVQFRTSHGPYHTVTTTKTGRNGHAKATVNATKTGYWRMVFDGNGVAGPSKASGDHVKVHK